ncbi:MAG: hypothetical protein H7345_09955 [Rubritepida sp.]|nr:hypothetical protein [Rubritepida sp.]
MDDNIWKGDAASAPLRAFLTRKGASPQCPSCSQESWNFVTVDGHTAAVPLIQDNGGWVSPPARIPVYVLICGNCAFVRQHAKIDVDQAS